MLASGWTKIRRGNRGRPAQCIRWPAIRAARDVKPIQRRRLTSSRAGVPLRAAMSARPRSRSQRSSVGSWRRPRAAGLLEAIAREEALSPNAFSLSVHNAVEGLFASSRRSPLHRCLLPLACEGHRRVILKVGVGCANWQWQCARRGCTTTRCRNCSRSRCATRSACRRLLLSTDADRAQYRLERCAVPGQPAAHWHQIRNLVNFCNEGSVT